MRVYHQVRSAHLERARELEPAVILHRSKRYDFDDELARDLDVRQVTAVGAAVTLFRARATAVEIGEPMSEGILFTTAALLGLAARRALGGPRASVVTYAIANLDPMTVLRRIGRPRALARLALYRALAGPVWRRVDRVVYGTDSARDLYHAVFPRHRPAAETVIPALPAARPVRDRHTRPGSVVFLGALVERKGFPEVLAAWPLVIASRPRARLTILGKGRLADQARRAAEADATITAEIDPPRQRIFEALDAGQVLVLPARATPTWREQVGLPIVEGLASGCSVVTTSQTGIADWLVAHGHAVIEEDASAQDLASAIIAQLDLQRPSSSVLDDLPSVDGRLAADAWLFGAAR